MREEEEEEEEQEIGWLVE